MTDRTGIRAKTIAAAAVTAALVVAGCEPADPGTPLPNVVGLHADKAKDALQQPDAYIAKDVTFHDVHTGESHARAVLIASHWTVCAQQPAAGSPSARDMTVTLFVVKNEEECPGAASAPPSGRPSASASSPAATVSQVQTTPAAITPATATAQPVVPTSHAPASSPPVRTVGCELTSPAGNCYHAGEFCPKADVGLTTHDATGREIVCRPDGSRNRWLYA